jgi:aminopeptidase-like protein
MKKDASNYEMSLLWILNLSDGQHSLLDIAEEVWHRCSSIQDGAKALIVWFADRCFLVSTC